MKEMRTIKLLVSCCNECPCCYPLLKRQYCQLTNILFEEGYDGNGFYEKCPMEKTELK